MVLSARQWVWFLCISLSCTRISADYLYQGSKFNAPAASSNDSDATCAYPVEATPTLTCPSVGNQDDLAGYFKIDLDDAEIQPPDVGASVALLQFESIDQVALTFTMRVIVFMQWEDSRSYSQIQAATAQANKTGKCQKYCSKATVSGGVGDCCDGIWLPTLQFLGAQPRTFAEEDFSITAYGPDFPVSDNSDMRNITNYQIQVTATVQQPFNFEAFPFDRHQLLMKILCRDCRFVADSDIGASAYFASFGFATKTDSQGDQADGQDVPASSGWQLNSVGLALVNITSDISTDRPSTRGSPLSTAANATADAYGLIFVVRVQRVTRFYFALQTIIPSIILVLIGFATFTVGQDKFLDRLRMLITVLFPTFVLQFTIANSLPKTYTLLSPQLLAFVSLVELALLIAICCATHHVFLNRGDRFAWKLSMKNTKAKYDEHKTFLLARMNEVEGEKDSKGEGSSTGDEEDPELVKRPSVLCGNGYAAASEPYQTCGEIASEKKREEAKKKTDHDEAVRDVAMRTQRGPKIFRPVRLWFTSLALSDAGPRRERAAMIWENWAISFAFILYVAVVLGIFLRVDHLGNNKTRL